MISLRRMTLGSGYRYLMESVATGDGAVGTSSSLTRYYAESGTPPGVFLGAGLAALDGGRGIEKGSAVTGAPLQPARDVRRPGDRSPPGPSAEPFASVADHGSGGTPRSRLPKKGSDDERTRKGDPNRCRARAPPAPLPDTGGRVRPHLFPLQIRVGGLGLADRATKARDLRVPPPGRRGRAGLRRGEVFRSRSGTNGVVEEDVEGVVAVASPTGIRGPATPSSTTTSWWPPRQFASDGRWRTLDSRPVQGVAALSELYHGVLGDLLTEALGWGWEERDPPPLRRLRFEVEGVAEALLAEFSQRSLAIRAQDELGPSSPPPAVAHRPAPSARLHRRATLDTRPAKSHASLAELTGRWRGRADPRRK